MSIQLEHPQVGRDTRRRAMEIALDLFSRNGYDATSMREIAEAAGVTKATLYYHFENKAAILISLLENYRLGLDELVLWAQQNPRPSPREILQAIAESVRTQGVQLFRFLYTNRQVIRDLPLEESYRYDIPESLYDALVFPETSTEWRIRAHMAVYSIHTSMIIAQGFGASDEEILRITLQISEEILHVSEK
jgi:AcrR family transcriptional regulator